MWRSSEGQASKKKERVSLWVLGGGSRQLYWKTPAQGKSLS